MGSVVDAVFGGSAKKAAKAQTAGLEKAAFEYKKGVQEAKSEVRPLFDSAMDIRRQRAGQAAEMTRAGLDPSLDVLSQGNMSAQQMLAGAAPQMQNAILGNAVDYSGLQPQGIDFNAQDFLSGLPSMSLPQQNVNQDALAAIGGSMSQPPSPMGPMPFGGMSPNNSVANMPNIDMSRFLGGTQVPNLGVTDYFGGGNTTQASNMGNTGRMPSPMRNDQFMGTMPNRGIF